MRALVCVLAVFGLAVFVLAVFVLAVFVLACGSDAGGGAQRASGAPNQRCSVAHSSAEPVSAQAT
jgi:hypothetical protein